MTSSKEFKQAVREGRLNDALAIAISNTPELQITTKISSQKDRSSSSEQTSLRTRFNLVEGKISNKIGEELINDDLYDFVQQFHLQQINQGQQIINHNLQSIQQIFRLLAVLQQQKQGEAYTPIGNWQITDNALPSPEEDMAIALASEINVAPEDEEEDIVNELLSLDDIDLEVEEPIQSEETSAEIAETLEAGKNDEDWGDWLNEDSLSDDVIVIDELDVEQSADWQSEDWGDETEFIEKDRE